MAVLARLSCGIVAICMVAMAAESAEDSLGNQLKKIFAPTPTPAPRKHHKTAAKKKASPTPSPTPKPKPKTAKEPLSSEAAEEDESSSQSAKRKKETSPTPEPEETPRIKSSKKSTSPEKAEEEASPKRKKKNSPTPEPEETATAKSSKKSTSKAEEEATSAASPKRKKKISPTPAPEEKPTPGAKKRHKSSPTPTPTETPEASPAESAAAEETETPEPTPTPKKKGAPVSISSSEIVGYANYPGPVQKVIDLSLDLASRGLDYKYGSDDPASGGMDCSGFVHYVLTNCGVPDVPRDSSGQYMWLRRAGTFEAVISRKEETFELEKLVPGDLLFWTGTYKIDRDPPITHAMIYVGREKGTKRRIMIGASDGRTYHGESRYGVSVFDFKLSPLSQTNEGRLTPTFVGYGHVPGLH